MVNFMLIIRTLLFFLGSTIVLILVSLSALLCFFIALRYRYAITSQWAKFNIWWLKIIIGLDYQIIGKENIPKQPCVILANHQSTWETLVFQVVFPQQVWVLKKQLLYIPIFGWGLAMTAPIIINRERKLQALKSVVKQGVKRLRRNLWVVIFPEGTRQGKGIRHYQSGGVMIAQKSGVSILPIYHNAGRYWKKRQFIKKPGVIKLVIGKPINPKSEPNKNAKELSLMVENWAKIQQQRYDN